MLAKANLEWDEPIPPFTTRFPGILESCLVTPLQDYQGFDPYPTLEDKAAMLFYLLIKNHPFKNGNKRIAVTSLLVFLSKNGKWLEVSPRKLYEIAKVVAGSDPSAMSSIQPIVREFIAGNLVDA